MHYHIHPPLRPRRGRALKVVLPTRVSDPRPGKQRETSTADQERMLRGVLEANWEGPTEVRGLAGSGSGEYLEREEYLELCDLVESGDYDLVLVEDLGRIVRRMHAHYFCEVCVDKGVRVIAINDNVDTARAGWQDSSVIAAWHHERSNRDTSERIKRSHVGSFERGGCLPPFLPYGYAKPEGAKHDGECYKLLEAEAVYEEWFERLDRDESYSEIADWLNATGISTGEGTRSAEWNGPMVGRVTHNPILKGQRYRNKRKTHRNAKGKYESRKADPQDLRLRPVPHLAFFEEAYYDRVVAKADARNRHCSRNKDGNDDRRRGPRKRTRFPGQSLVCGICGRPFVFGAHGQRDHLMCDGARQYRCWNGISIDGPLAARKIVSAIWAECELLPDFDEAFLAEVNREADRLDTERDGQLSRLEREITRLKGEFDKLLGFEATDRLRARQRELEARLDELGAEREHLLGVPTERIEIPSADVIRELAEIELNTLAPEDPALVRLAGRIAPRIVVFPHRILDGNTMEHRARFRLRLANLLDGTRAREALDGVMERTVEADLFEPPEREAFRAEIVRLRAGGMRELDAAAECGITTTAAQRAASLQRRMDECGLDDPWVPLTEPPDDIRKFKRHRHRRYRFEPLADAGEF